MREIGIVQKVFDDFAEITAVRKTACGESCKTCSGGCKLTKNTVIAKNTINAQKGEVVEFEASTNAVLKSAFLVYILPLLIFFFGYFVVYHFSKSELSACVSGILLFALAYVVLHILDRKNCFGVKTEIVNIIKKK